jgi:N-glycosylase/DNA lyase
MRQEAHQCISFFVCASNTTMFMTSKMLKSLCKKFGYKIIFDGKEFYTFPSVSSLNKASINELQSCGVGYRAKAIKAVAKHIVSGSLDTDNLIRIKYHEGKEELWKVYGIGNKIAIILLDKLDAFPIYIWILRAISRHYSWLFNEKENENKCKMTERITINQYSSIRQYEGKSYRMFSELNRTTICWNRFVWIESNPRFSVLYRKSKTKKKIQ